MPWDKQFDKRVALEKATAAFWTRGFEATSMQDLVECTGVNRASLYATYGDKRSLFMASLKSYDEGRQDMLAKFEVQFTPREAIRQVFLNFTRDVGQCENKGCFVTNSALELASHDEEIRKVVSGAQKDLEAFFVRMIKKGQKVGEIPKRVAPKQAARGLLASLTGLLVLVRSRPERSLLKTIVEDAMDRIS